nr:ABC-2 transporter permease [uncultured Agathobaculum sp.]
MREMLYVQWTGIRMPLLQMAVRVGAVSLFGMLLAGPMMLCLIVVMPAVLMPRLLCDTALSPGWEAYSLTLPAGRRSIVASRFVLVLCGNMAATATCLVGMAVCRAVSGATEKMPNDLALVLICAAWAMSASGLMIAVSYRCGLDRANYLIVGSIGALYLVIVMVRRIEVFHLAWQRWSGWLTACLAGYAVAAAFLTMLAGCMVFGLCYLWSAHVYQKKEL